MGNICVQTKNKNREFGEVYTAKTEPVQQTAAQKQAIAQSRRCTISQEEVVMAKLRMQMDRIETRISNLEKNEKAEDEVIKSLIQSRKKEEAFHSLKKKKNIRECIKANRQKMEMLDRQFMNIENSIEELGFTNALKESNKVIEKLNSEMDLEEVRLAKQLQEEGKMRREELMELLDDDDEEDSEIKLQLDDIERAMVEEALSKFPSQMSVTGNKDRSSVKEELQAELEF